MILTIFLYKISNLINKLDNKLKKEKFMSWGSSAFAYLHVIKASFHLLENLAPSSNWNLYDKEYRFRLPVKEQEKIGNIEKIKNKVCDLYHVPPENITLRVQKTDTIQSHGNFNHAVLGIGQEFLAHYHLISANKEDKKLNENIKTLKRFLDYLPNDVEEIKLEIQKLKKHELENYQSLIKEHCFDLTDEEIQFVLAHEIAGHISSNEALWTGAFSSLLSLNVWCTANLVNHYLPFFGSNFVWQSVFYGLSQVALQSVWVKRQEQKADIKALDCQENVEGGIKFFKRMLVIQLLNHPHECIKTTKENKSFFKIEGKSLLFSSYESAATRLLRCLATKEREES